MLNWLQKVNRHISVSSYPVGTLVKNSAKSDGNFLNMAFKSNHFYFCLINSIEPKSLNGKVRKKEI